MDREQRLERLARALAEIIEEYVAATAPPAPPASDPPPLLVTPEEASRMCGVHERTLRRQGVPRIQLGRSVRYRVTDLQAWIRDLDQTDPGA